MPKFFLRQELYVTKDQYQMRGGGIWEEVACMFVYWPALPNQLLANVASEARVNTNTVESENFIFTRDGYDTGFFEWDKRWMRQNGLGRGKSKAAGFVRWWLIWWRSKKMTPRALAASKKSWRRGLAN